MSELAHVSGCDTLESLTSYWCLSHGGLKRAYVALASCPNESQAWIDSVTPAVQVDQLLIASVGSMGRLTWVITRSE